MKRINVQQGTIEWHEARYRKIGGSTSKGLFVNSDTLLIEMLGQFIEDFDHEDGFISDAMERGNELEPYAIEELNKYTGLEFNSVGWLQCEEIPLLGISPDGITDDNKFSCETKCPQRKKHTETIIADEIPLDHLHQCLHYFTVNPELEKHYFVSFRPENTIKPLFVKELTRDSIINLGTKAKPVNKSIYEWVAIAKGKAIELQLKIDKTIKQLEF